MSTITGVCQHSLYCEQSVRQIKYNDPDLKRCKKKTVCVLLYYQLHDCGTNAGKLLWSKMFKLLRSGDFYEVYCIGKYISRV